jgi:DNA-binding CsgD family transcriptional regulator
MTVVALPRRQREVLIWAARGKTTLDTAEILGISPRTVEVHRLEAARALGAANVTNAVAIALSSNLIQLGENHGGNGLLNRKDFVPDVRERSARAQAPSTA